MEEGTFHGSAHAAAERTGAASVEAVEVVARRPAAKAAAAAVVVEGRSVVVEVVVNGVSMCGQVPSAMRGAAKTPRPVAPRGHTATTAAAGARMRNEMHMRATGGRQQWEAATGTTGSGGMPQHTERLPPWCETGRARAKAGTQRRRCRTTTHKTHGRKYAATHTHKIRGCAMARRRVCACGCATTMACDRLVAHGAPHQQQTGARVTRHLRYMNLTGLQTSAGWRGWLRVRRRRVRGICTARMPAALPQQP